MQVFMLHIKYTDLSDTDNVMKISSQCKNSRTPVVRKQHIYFISRWPMG